MGLLLYYQSYLALIYSIFLNLFNFNGLEPYFVTLSWYFKLIKKKIKAFFFVRSPLLKKITVWSLLLHYLDVSLRIV